MSLSFGSCLLDEHTGELRLKDRAPDVFKVFGLTYAYEYDSELLERRYLELSKLTHPDHQETSDEASRQRIINVSAWVNQSYRDIKNSLFRAEFLLSLLETRNQCHTDSKKLPGTFLMDMLELQEELENPATRADEDRLEEIAEQAENSRKKALKSIGENLDNCIDSELVDQESLQSLRNQLNTIRYYDRILGTVEDLLDKL